MKGRLLFLIALFVLFAPRVFSQRQERVINSWRPLHYDVNLSFNDQLNEITSARTEVSGVILKDTETIDLDFGRMEIDLITIGGRPAYFEWTPQEVLTISLAGIPSHAGAKFNIVIAYHGRPKDGLVFATDRDGRPSVTGDNWPNRVHQWIPCFDHPSAKATVTFTVAAPPRDLVVANGKFFSMNANEPGQHVWQFQESKPIPAYCMVIAVNEGAKLDVDPNPVTPLSFYVPQKDRGYAPKGFAPGAPALAFFSETIAPYPYEKLALIVGATRFGGMENSSAIVFASGLFDLRQNEKLSAHFGIPARIESVVAHEIAHQWFGDSVTESTWADLWLSEGFATYFAGLFIEKYDGEDAFRDYLRNAAEKYLAYEKRRSAPIRDTETPDLMKLLNENNYEKGAWVLHMLRTRLGDEKFFRGLRGYYNAHHEATATTEDLRDALEKASGQNLHQFFARWVFGVGLPIYDLSWSYARGKLLVTLKQTQASGAFLDPVPIKIVSGAVSKRAVIQPRDKLTTMSVAINATPTSIQIDPDGMLLKEVVKR